VDHQEDKHLYRRKQHVPMKLAVFVHHSNLFHAHRFPLNLHPEIDGDPVLTGNTKKGKSQLAPKKTIYGLAYFNNFIVFRLVER
jgi:hypothetical protein